MARRDRRPLYTIGHSTRTVAELIEALRAWEVERLVDIRHFTRSRRNPQFNGDVLGPALGEAGIAYAALEGLGGRRGPIKGAASPNTGWQHSAFRNYADYATTEAFSGAFETLVGWTARWTCAVMCAEAVWWRCHRRIVADYAITRGIRVFHIFTARKAEPASRTPFARVARVGGRVALRYVEAGPSS